MSDNADTNGKRKLKVWTVLSGYYRKWCVIDTNTNTNKLLVE